MNRFFPALVILAFSVFVASSGLVRAAETSTDNVANDLNAQQAKKIQQEQDEMNKKVQEENAERMRQWREENAKRIEEWKKENSQPSQ
jgi:predicted Holliday junction resolvase-like endonuclease